MDVKSIPPPIATPNICISASEGFSLLEMLLSITLFCVTILFFTQWVHVFSRSTSLAHKDEGIDNVMVRVVDAFGDSETFCNYILSNIPANPNANPNLRLTMAEPGGAQVTSIDLHDRTGLTLVNVLTLARPVEKRQDLIISDIRLKPVAEVSANEFVASLEFKFTRIGSPGSPEVFRRIPIHATVDPATNYVVSCTAAAETSMQIQDIICEINSDGYAHYDPSVRDCVDNSNVFWVNGASPLEASCPSGAHIAASRLDKNAVSLACAAQGPGINLPARTYQNGAVDEGANFQAWRASIDSNFKKCVFVYATTTAISAYTSQIKCAR